MLKVEHVPDQDAIMVGDFKYVPADAYDALLRRLHAQAEPAVWECRHIHQSQLDAFMADGWEPLQFWPVASQVSVKRRVPS